MYTLELFSRPGKGEETCSRERDWSLRFDVGGSVVERMREVRLRREEDMSRKHSR